MLVSFLGIEGSLVFGDVRFTGTDERVRHVIPIQSCIFERMCKGGSGIIAKTGGREEIKAYVGGFG
jgi:hypothetical protein